MKIIKFIGKFRDLKPDEWSFHKLYARNYRCYRKECDGKHSQGCWVFQRGGYLEIDGLSHPLDVMFVEKIIDGSIEELKSRIKDSKLFPDEDVMWLQIDTKELKFHPYHSAEYREIRRMKLLGLYDLEKTVSPEEFKEMFRNYYKRYKECNIDLNIVKMLQDLLAKNWITIVDNKSLDR